MKLYLDISYQEDEKGLALLARLLPFIRDANPDHFAWHVGSQPVEKLAAKDSESRVKKASRRALGSLKYDVFTVFQIGTTAALSSGGICARHSPLADRLGTLLLHHCNRSEPSIVSPASPPSRSSD